MRILVYEKYASSHKPIIVPSDDLWKARWWRLWMYFRAAPHTHCFLVWRHGKMKETQVGYQKEMCSPPQIWFIPSYFSCNFVSLRKITKQLKELAWDFYCNYVNWSDKTNIELFSNKYSRWVWLDPKKTLDLWIIIPYQQLHIGENPWFYSLGPLV